MKRKANIEFLVQHLFHYFFSDIPSFIMKVSCFLAKSELICKQFAKKWTSLILLVETGDWLNYTIFIVTRNPIYFNHMFFRLLPMVHLFQNFQVIAQKMKFSSKDFFSKLTNVGFYVVSILQYLLQNTGMQCNKKYFWL